MNKFNNVVVFTTYIHTPFEFTEDTLYRAIDNLVVTFTDKDFIKSKNPIKVTGAMTERINSKRKREVLDRLLTISRFVSTGNVVGFPSELTTEKAYNVGYVEGALFGTACLALLHAAPELYNDDDSDTKEITITVSLKQPDNTVTVLPLPNAGFISDLQVWFTVERIKNCT